MNISPHKAMYKTLYILIALFLGSCSQAMLDTPEALVEPTTSPTPSPATTASPNPSSTSTPTRTLTPTITYIPYPDSPSLRSLMLSMNDLESSDVQDKSFIDDIQIYFYYEGTLLVLDKSNDVQSGCLIECTRQVWYRSPQYLAITMVRMNSEQDAFEEASTMYSDLKPFSYEYTEDELNSFGNLPQNSHFAVSKWNKQLVLTTSRGPIVFKIELFRSFGDNATVPPIIIIAFANLQINKLQQANVIP